MKRRIISINVNGTDREFLVAPNKVLLEVLREEMRLTGTKFGCEQGECGACTVLLDGVPALSCITLAVLCDGRRVETVEGLEGREADLVRQAFAEEGASQCGYCTPSMAVMLTYLLRQGREVDIREELSGNLCRCTGYVKIMKAYEKAAELARK